MPAGQEPPPDEVLAALVASLRAELAGARAELERALGRIAELEARLAQTPRNSSKPPSGEGLAKPAPRPRSLRKQSGRRPGGQDGHRGLTLTRVARPDREVRHEPGCCGRCGAALAGQPVTGVERRQVFDLPTVRAEVTEHQLIERECGCGQRTRAAAPPGADGPVCYGPRVAAVIIYLYAGQFLSKKRTAQALAELFVFRCRPSCPDCRNSHRRSLRLCQLIGRLRKPGKEGWRCSPTLRQSAPAPTSGSCTGTGGSSPRRRPS